MKHVVIPIIVLAVLLGVGIYESICNYKTFEKFESQIDELISLCEEETLDEQRYLQFVQYWHDIRVKSEFFLPHNDVYEITLRVSEITAYVKAKDYELCLGHLAVLKELASYAGRITIPSIGHVF